MMICGPFAIANCFNTNFTKKLQLATFLDGINQL